MVQGHEGRIFFDGGDILAHEKRQQLVYITLCPMPVHFLTSVDVRGNDNTMVVTQFLPCADMDPLRFAFSIRRLNIGNHLGRQTYDNIIKTREFVLSIPGKALAREISVCGNPYLPYGISEITVASLTPYASNKVQPPSIKECKINMELTLDHVLDLNIYSLIVGTVVGLSVNTEIWELVDNRLEQLKRVDPLMEVDLSGSPPRHDLMPLDKDGIVHLEDIGSSRILHGAFDQWLDELVEENIISSEKRNQIITIWKRWENFRDPIANATMETQLTQICQYMCNKDWEGLNGFLPTISIEDFDLDY